MATPPLRRLRRWEALSQADDPRDADAPSLLQSRNGAVAILTLNAPAKRNALTSPARAELADAIDRIERDSGIRAVMLTGGPRGFCGGGDLSAMEVEGLASAPE